MIGGHRCRPIRSCLPARPKTPRRPLFRLLLLVLATWRLCPAAAAPLEYNDAIRPILLDACISCHGPDSASRQADLRLDQRESAVAFGAIVPGEPENSELLRRVLSNDPSERMPPPEIKKTLTDQQIATLEQWIREGAAYQPHWSLIPPVASPPPAMTGNEWVRNPIDHFIADRLQQVGLTPAAEADRRTLARRVGLDLTGLPPTPEMVSEFMQDTSPGAYERLVDRLLASPRWGEHRGRYWLDAARYADTHGIHFDNYREMWSYRDWVIDAFNRNLPFDQFTIENLAGDLLPSPTLDQQIASGFNRCHITTNEGGVIPEEYLVLYTRDRTETTATVWLGLTVGCAVCHDHKFDPLTQHEFYELAAFFNNTTQAALDGNVQDTPPVIVVPTEEDQPRWEALTAAVPAAEQRVQDQRLAAGPPFDAWLSAAQPSDLEDLIPTTGLELHAPLNDGGDILTYVWNETPSQSSRPASVEWVEARQGAQAAYLNGGVVLTSAEAGDFDQDQPYSVAAWVKLPANDASGALVARMDDAHDYRGWDLWIEGRRVGGHLIHHWPDDALKVLTSEPLPADEWVHVTLVYDGSQQASGLKVFVNGRPRATQVAADRLHGTTVTEVPLKIGMRHASSAVSGVGLTDVRVYRRNLPADEVATLAAASRIKDLAQMEPTDRDAVFEWWLTHFDHVYTRLKEEHEALQREQSDIRERGTVAHVMRERSEPPMAHVLKRGEYDQALDQVSPDTPGMLPPFPAELSRDRLGFARWLLQEDQPLTARVTVNRFWQEVFGVGLVRSVGDFGVSGELPSHPELLDWLAVDFRESGWNVKRLFKMLVCSATYRQAAMVTPHKLELDPDNRLLSRGPRFRMDAEMIRDYSLAASGLLSARIGGPSVKPYQPSGVWEAVAMDVSNTRNYVQDTGESLYRRSLYTFWKRAAPPASLEIFNAPNREHCVVMRERTQTPLQALVTLNDPQFVETARHLAQRTLIESAATTADRLNFLAERILIRPLLAEEQSILSASQDRLADFYTAEPEEAKRLIHVGESVPDESLAASELATWTMVANQLLNLDEVLNK